MRQKDDGHQQSRSAALYAKKIGLLTPQPCVFCGGADAQMHHDDYSRPFDVEWMCQPCHGAYHRELRAASGV